MQMINRALLAGATMLSFLLAVTAAVTVFAQEAPWTAPVRGAWVQRGAAQAEDVVLAEHGSGCAIVVGANEKPNVRQAAEFLADDIANISGYRPPIVQAPESGRAIIRMVTLGNGEIPSEIDAAPIRGQWESYRIATMGRAVWLVGANPRGTAFAAYTLSERLGIDPLYIWTGYRPQRRDPLVLKRVRFAQNPPAFRYRGFFHDDEDILPRPFDDRGYPLQTGDVPAQWYKRFFETALRLRMNMVAPYVRVHRRVEVQKLASDWGLFYTSHHYDTLLSNPFGLVRFNLAAERGVKPEWNWFTNRDGMLRYWRGGVEENRDLDAIWPVGMRGTEDRPFVFPPGTTDEQKARTFREVIHDQVEMTKELVPKDRQPSLFHFTMYNEMLTMYQRDPAAFDLPPGVMIVWPDDNDGHMRALPPSLGKWKHGVYYHLAYLGGNLTKQLTHIVPPETVADQFSSIVHAGATEFVLVNVSELREYVMTARMIGEIAWNAPAIYASPDVAQRYTAWWTREYFGGSAETGPADAASAYMQYFRLLNRPDSMWLAADGVQDLLEQLYHKVAREPVQPLAEERIVSLQSRLPMLESALAAEARAERAMSMSQQRLFHEDVALGLMVEEKQIDAALKLNEALAAPDAARMWPLVLEARAPLEALEIELERGEHPPFDRWYHETWIRSALSRFNPHRSYQQLRAFIASEGRGTLEKMAVPTGATQRPTSGS